jgi:hypothetical protein
VHAPRKCILFLWLAILGRCWTSERCHRRHSFRDSPDCVLCAQAPEHVDHLLLGCLFTRKVWFLFLGRYGWHVYAPTSSTTLASWWLLARKQVAKARRKAFNSGSGLYCVVCLAAAER